MSEVLLPTTRSSCAATRTSSPAASSSASAWPWRSPAGPSVIVLDEPTTGLDVTTQAHVLATVRDLCRSHGVAALYVTHDLAVVANLADRVAVMYAGRIVEQGPTAAICSTDPAHPYTRQLVAAAPDMTGDRAIVGLPGARRRRVTARRAARSRRAASSRPTRAAPSSRRCDEVAAGHRCAASTRSQVAGARASAAATRAPSRRPRDAVLTLARRVACVHAGITVVHGVDLHVERGECLALVGESGIGQDDALPLDRRPAPRVDRRDPARRRDRWRSRPRDRADRPAAADPVRLPEPVQLAQPAAHDRRVGRPAAVVGGASAAEARRARSARCSSGCR